VLTHCNAGWLACVDWGTALAPMYVAAREGRRPRVLVDETRPRLQGANLTAWELGQEGVDYEIVADNAAGHLMRGGEVDLVITGADRIAANGDAANKIGTYEKALLAERHGIPFYVAAPARRSI
jgi:translation initiation factor eIF-2B subunit alpha